MKFKISLAELHTGLSRSSFIRNFGNIDILHSILPVVEILLFVGSRSMLKKECIRLTTYTYSTYELAAYKQSSV